VIVVMRHGDRRPKEKLKFKTTNPGLLAYFDGTTGKPSEILVKSPEDMQKLKDTVRLILSEMGTDPAMMGSEKYAKFDTLRLVLELHESFEGVTRKVQLKPIEFNSATGRPTRILVVAKWGGELTDMGRDQAEELGRRLRQTMFPVSSADGTDDSLLRLHSSFRHDFKIYSSIEGRCQTTAAAFTKGFLDLEGDLTPILVSLVFYDDFARGLLDEPVPKDDRNKVKEKIANILHSNTNSDKLFLDMVPENQSGGVYEAVRLLLAEGSPFQCLCKVHEACLRFIAALGAEIKKISDDHPTVLEAQLTVNPPRTSVYQRMRTVSDVGGTPTEIPFTGPGPRLQQRVDNMILLRWVQLRRIEHRWTKLVYGFTSGDGGHVYDTSKVTDLWDCAYYDIVHHNQELPESALAILQRDVMRILIPLQAWVSTAEFGITGTDKLRIGVETTWRLLQKMVNDIEFMLEENDARLVGESPGGAAVGQSPSSSGELGAIMASNARLAFSQAAASSGMTTPVAANSMRPGGKPSKVPPELRALLRQAMRDGSDWHPQLHETVAQITGMKSSKCVRTRVYVTSASTMHSLLNVLAFGSEVSDENLIDRSKLSGFTDLQYLSHFVIRCFEGPEGDDATGASPPSASRRPITSNKYAVEILFSPGVQCEAQPLTFQVDPDLLRENSLCVAPLQPICYQECCSLEDFDAFLTEVLAECGKLSHTEQVPTVSSPRMG
jgi:inositol-hexakisphosphate/diphosphoinositol-pentakisphosphate 1-kinase